VDIQSGMSCHHSIARSCRHAQGDLSEASRWAETFCRHGDLTAADQVDSAPLRDALGITGRNRYDGAELRRAVR